MLVSMKRTYQLFQPNTLACFSPPIMAATIIIEWSLAIWIWYRYRQTTSRKLMIAILVCLGGFQLAEYNVCGQANGSVIWSRAGYMLITMLPALGLHLVAQLAHQKTRFIWLGYILAAGFIAAMAIDATLLTVSVCTGNYVIFTINPGLYKLWSLYYMGFVLFAMGMAAHLSGTTAVKSRAALRWLAIGYLSFTLPTFVIYWLLPMTHHGLPSIMCGFAVILAVIIGLKVAPLAPER